MEIKTKYNIGDRVYYAFPETVEIEENCPICNGSGEITLNNETFNCPKCLGGIIYNYKYIYSPRLTTIAIIKIEVNIDGTIDERYMTKLTGFPSGSNISVNNLFSTKEECEKYCEKMNCK